MTGPIKPPGGPKIPDVAPAKSGQKAASTFSAAADSSQAEAQQTAQAGEVSTAAQIGADLEAGRISGPEAVEQMVQDLLDGPMAAQLTDEGKAALEAHLRQSLADDPSLVAMTKALD